VFNKAIHGSELNTEAANRLFSNITATDAPDQSFLATLRVLLHKRLPTNEKVKLVCRTVRLSASDFRAETPLKRTGRIMLDIIQHCPSNEHNIQILFITNEEISLEVLEFLKTHIGKGTRHLVNFNRRDELHAFYARKLNSLFFTDDEEKNTLIFISKKELKHFHALQMMIPKYLPQLFSGNPLTETETALLKSTGNKSAVEYENLIKDLIHDLDFRSELIRIKLSGFERMFEQLRKDEIKKEINTHQRNYDSQLSNLQETARKLQDSKYILAGLESTLNAKPKDSDLIEYFMCNKKLTVIQSYRTTLEFVAHGYADIYDLDAFNQYVGNHDGYLYTELNPSITNLQMERLYRAIFNDGRYKLRICAAYTVEIRSGLKAFSNYTFPDESLTYFPNPHIQQYGCIGTYAGRFQEYMNRQDYVGAIEQASVSARNLNFYDSAVMSGFSKSFSRTTKKCLEKSDGTLLTPKDAILEMEGDSECQDLLS
jgi:rubrerythrin